MCVKKTKIRQKSFADIFSFQRGEKFRMTFVIIRVNSVSKMQ